MTHRNIFKVRFNQTDEELEKAIDTKLKGLGFNTAQYIKQHWRRKGADLQFAMMTGELIYVVSFIESLTEGELADLLLELFRKWNVEFFKTADWISTFRTDPPEERLPHHRKDGADENTNGLNKVLVFRDKDQYEEWLDQKKKKDVIVDALEEAGVGDGN